MARILSQSGNVIAADFEPRVADSLTVEVKSKILYCDHLVCLVRFDLLFMGKVIATEHVTAQQPTGNQP